VALHLRLVSLDENVTAAPDQTAGGGRLVSRDWAGRLLYNCVVLGRRFTIPAAPGVR